jgi:hypothetical protein
MKSLRQKQYTELRLIGKCRELMEKLTEVKRTELVSCDIKSLRNKERKQRKIKEQSKWRTRSTQQTSNQCRSRKKKKYNDERFSFFSHWLSTSAFCVVSSVSSLSQFDEFFKSLKLRCQNTKINGIKITIWWSYCKKLENYDYKAEKNWH